MDAAGTLDNSTDPYEVDFGRGPVLLDLEPGDKAEFLESKTPATEFQSFAQLMVSVALKSLDIPYSFFDESFTNFYGSRGALLHYQKSCEAKRADVKDVLRKLTTWRMSLWIDDGVLSLPSGVSLSDLNGEWIPAGLAWWDPAKEIRGDVEAINAGLRTRSEIRAEKYGDDWIDVVDQLARERVALEERGLMPDADDAPADAETGVDNEEDN
jgi:capsid protein